MRPKNSRDPKVAQRIISLIQKYEPISLNKLMQKYAELYGSCSARWLSQYLDFLSALGIVEYKTVVREDRKPWEPIYGGWCLTEPIKAYLKMRRDKRYWLVLGFWLIRRDPIIMFGEYKGRHLHEFVGYPHLDPTLLIKIVQSIVSEEICLRCFALYNELWPIQTTRNNEDKCINPNHDKTKRTAKLDRKLEKELKQIRELAERIRLRMKGINIPIEIK